MRGDPLSGECSFGVPLEEDTEDHTAQIRFELPALSYGRPGSVWCYFHRQWTDFGTQCVQKWD